MSAIRVEGLVKTFGPVRALDGLDLVVERGTVFGFLGPNGAGKTTTIRILVGLARPSDGRAWVAGVELPAGRRQVSHRIGYLSEEPAFYPWMTARELVDHVGRIYGLSAGERKARTGELLDLVGLAEVAGRRIGGFSHGMRRRLGIAQALINRPEVLFLDEPVNALDPAGRREALELLGRLRAECTVFMSTHVLADVERVCDVVGIISEGRMLVTARQDDLIERYAAPVFEVESDVASVERLAGWARSVQQQRWVTGVTLDGSTARVLVSNVETARRELLSSVVQAGLLLSRYEMVRPSLEDVFLRLVGEGGGGP
jgi:ABC-2 type transport system ATP-binding protein